MGVKGAHRARFRIAERQQAVQTPLRQCCSHVSANTGRLANLSAQLHHLALELLFCLHRHGKHPNVCVITFQADVS